METKTELVSNYIRDLEKYKIKFYARYLKKNRNKFENNSKIIQKLRKYKKEVRKEPSLRLEEVFSEIFLLDIFKKNGYDFKVDFKNTRNNKNVDFLIELSNSNLLLLEVYTPNESTLFPYEKNSRRPVTREIQPISREEAKKRPKEKYCWVVDERWQREVAYKILNEAFDRKNKFADGDYEKILLFNISDFNYKLRSFDDFWDKFFEDGRGLIREKDEMKNRENLLKLGEIKDFYTGLIFLKIFDGNDGTDFVNFYIKLFTQTNKPMDRFLKRLLKEERPGIFQLFFLESRKESRIILNGNN